MRFVLNLTLREIRSSWRRLLFFFLCIAVGVGSVVALRSMIQNLNKVVGNDARALMTADVEISSTNDFAPSEIAAIEAVTNRFPTIEARTEVMTTAVMARPADTSNPSLEFIELKGITSGFPLVGDFLLSDGSPFEFSLVENDGAVIGRVILDELKIAIGDKIRIGERQFTVRATFDEEPGGASGFRLGPRVFVDIKAFEAAGILRTTSRIRRRILYRTSNDPTELVRELRQALQGTTVQANSYREQQENMNEQFARAENYLSLTGLLILVLGGVGVWNVSRAFVEQKRKTIAILKCLGSSGNRVITVYLLQVLFLGLIGSFLGVVLAQCGLTLVRWQFQDALPAKMSYVVTFSTAWQGVALGLMISMLFAALPLLQIRHIKPRMLLRDDNNLNIGRLSLSKWLLAGSFLTGLLALAVWQAGSLRVGVFFLAGLAITGGVLYLSATVLTSILKRVVIAGSFPLRQAVNSLYRPGNQTRVVLLAVGLGVLVVLTVTLMQENLVREFDLTRNSRLPSLIFVDAQRSQIGEVARLIESHTGEKPELVPTVRARIAAVNGEPIDYQQTEIRQNQGQIGREFALTYRPNLEDNESVVAGDWWPADEPSSEPEVSIDERMAKTLKVSPGDTMTFDISGRALSARVRSLRKIDLRNARSAFVFVFRPGALDKAPQSFAATVLHHVPATVRQQLQRQVVDSFPNVQVIDVADVLATFKRVLDNFVIAISFVGSFVLLAGILILIGSVALTRSQRIYENAILKTLGASRSTLAMILISEYGLLGALAGSIATGFAYALSFAVSRYMMDIEWTFDPVTGLLGVLASTLLVTLVGTAASFDVLFRRPLATLRSQ